MALPKLPQRCSRALSPFQSASGNERTFLSSAFSRLSEVFVPDVVVLQSSSKATSTTMKARAFEKKVGPKKQTRNESSEMHCVLQPIDHLHRHVCARRRWNLKRIWAFGDWPRSKVYFYLFHFSPPIAAILGQSSIICGAVAAIGEESSH